MKEKEVKCPNCGEKMEYLPKGSCDEEGIVCKVEYVWICLKCGKEIKE